MRKTPTGKRKTVDWNVYILRCSDRSLYTGITTDMARRMHQHATGRGAKYVRGRQPLQVVYLESGHTRSSAGKREAMIKCLTIAEKLRLLSSEANEVAALDKLNDSRRIIPAPITVKRIGSAARVKNKMKIPCKSIS